MLTEHFGQCETEGIEWNTVRYKWVIERLQEVFLMVSLDYCILKSSFFFLILLTWLFFS